MMDAFQRAALLEDELLFIRHSGELPEVALHSSLHALCESADGPALRLEASELCCLEEAVWRQYQRILLRDLQPDNRKRSIFRGLARAICNWRRLVRFGHNMNPPHPPEPAPIVQALIHYLRTEIEDLQAGHPSGSINCSAEELFLFARELRCVEQLPAAWRELFPGKLLE